MASSIGHSGGGRGRGFPAQMPAGGIEDAQTRVVGLVARAEKPAAVETARVSADASQSGVHSSDNDGLQAIFRRLLMDHVKKVAKYYLIEEFVTDDGHNTLVDYTVDTIIAFEGNRLPPTEKLMEQYISQIEKTIKDLVKQYVDMFWIGAGLL